MVTVLTWKEAMAFDAAVDQHVVRMDAKPPLGRGAGPTPKELVAMGLGGCTAMDVIALLKKHKQVPASFTVSVDIQTTTQGMPAVFENALITFTVEGTVEKDVLIDAVSRSQHQYCGVSAMLVKAFPIRYKIVLNGTEVGTGVTHFP
jgi:putative redox protein